MKVIVGRCFLNQLSQSKYLQKNQHYISFPPPTRATINLILTFVFTGLIEGLDIALQLLTHPNHLQADQIFWLLFAGAGYAVLHAGLTYFGSNATLEQEVQKLETQVEQDASAGKPLF